MSKYVARLSQITKRLSELNGSWGFKCTPGQAEGVEIKFEDSLRHQLTRLKLKEFENTIKVKLSGDGTQIGRRLKLENCTHTILDEKDVVMSEEGNYI